MDAQPGTSNAQALLEQGEHTKPPPPQLQNMVATVNLGCKLELKQIALKARNSEYNPKASLLCLFATASLLRP